MDIEEEASLLEVEASAWSELERGALSPESGFRQVSLCSVDASLRPQARMVVLRKANRRGRLLEFHSDIRSRKWSEIKSKASVTVLGFCTRTRLQLRLKGTATLHGPLSEQAEEAWTTLSEWTRRTYTGGPPGDALGNDTQLPMAASGCTTGKAVFGILTFQVETLDWFMLERGNNRRAEFIYNDMGVLVSSRSINP